MLVGNIYVLAFYAHPEDRNQAWFPKIVVLLGLTLAFLSVLMLPLDRANRNACDQSKIVSACTFTLPMTALWCGLRWLAIMGPLPDASKTQDIHLYDHDLLHLLRHPLHAVLLRSRLRQVRPQDAKVLNQQTNTSVASETSWGGWRRRGSTGSYS